jgi:hypothetical protein
MSDRMVVLAVFGNPVEAELARARLEDEGIRAVIMGTGSGDVFAGMGVGLSNVQLLVPEEDRERAAEALDAAESDLARELREERESLSRRGRRRKKQSTAIKEEETAANPSTDIRPADESPAPADPADAPPPPAEMEAEEPPPEDDGAEDEIESRPVTWTPDDMAERAFRAALFGYFTCGILHLYALWILAYIPSTEGALSPSGSRKAWAALALSALPYVVGLVIILAAITS